MHKLTIAWDSASLAKDTLHANTIPSNVNTTSTLVCSGCPRMGQQNLLCSLSGLPTSSGGIRTTFFIINTIQVPRRLPSIKNECLVFRKHSSEPILTSFSRKINTEWTLTASRNWPRCCPRITWEESMRVALLAA